MSQYSYYLLTIPYNSCSAFYFIIQLSTIEVLSEKLFENHSMCLWNLFGTQRKFQSECSDDVLKDTSRGMKCLMTHKETYFTSGCHPKMNIWVFREYPVGTPSHSARSWYKRFFDISRYLCITQRFGILTFSYILTLLLPLHMCIDIRKMFSTCWDRT